MPRSPILVSTKSAERARPYLEALRAGGASGEELRVVTPDTAPQAAETLAADAAGLLLCGGDDVDPGRYNEEQLAGAGVQLDARRDALEWALLEHARSARVPTFAVCRGLQVANVFLGGSLWQDLRLQRGTAVDHDQRQPRDLLAHELEVLPGAHPLAEQLGPAALRVNSRHHQGVRRLAPDLVALARSADGLVEAAALPADSAWWLFAVQWHPENLLALPAQRALWHAFVTAGSAVR
jgi:putative glutamine amidotransferase